MAKSDGILIGNKSTVHVAMYSDEYAQIISLHAEYAAAVDGADWDRWVDLFTDDCHYSIHPRENYERGLPLATLSFESKGMLRDRIYGIRETLWHDPYYQCHVIGTPRIIEADSVRFRVETNYAVFRTKPSQLTSVFNVGRYIDEIVRWKSRLRFSSKTCVYDSELIPNSIIYPI